MTSENQDIIDEAMRRLKGVRELLGAITLSWLDTSQADMDTPDFTVAEKEVYAFINEVAKARLPIYEAIKFLEPLSREPGLVLPVFAEDEAATDQFLDGIDDI
jgi:hypothetical protein